jgi:hypothetical protein
VRLRTANNHRRRILRRRILIAAFNFDMKQCARMSASGTLHKRVNSGFVRRDRQRARARMRQADIIIQRGY